MGILIVCLIVIILFLILKVNKIAKNILFFNENLLTLTKKLDDINKKLDEEKSNAKVDDFEEEFGIKPVEFTPVEVDEEHNEEKVEDNFFIPNNEVTNNDNKPKDLATLVKQASLYRSDYSTTNRNQDNSTLPLEEITEDIAEPKESSFESKIEKQPNTLAIRTKELLNRIWQWIIVGDDYARKDVPKEYSIAITWLLRCAVLLIVFGIGYFVKYSHDNNLFPPQLRLLISSIVTMGLIASGCYLLKTKYRIFGATLGGAGFIGLYLTIFAGVALYKVITPLSGLIMLIVITFSGVALSLVVNYMFLSILAICGGFLAPVLISTGSRNFTGLFIYMIVLALGATSVARFRNWPILNILSFILVWAIFILAEPFKVTFDYPYSLALLFATIFFLIFTLQNSFFNTWLKRKSTLVEVGLEFLNCIIFTSITLGNYPSLYWAKELAAFIPLGVAIILFSQLFLLKYKNVEDKAFKLTIMVLICCFLTLSIPLALAAKYVTCFWAILALSILYIGSRTSTKALAIIGCILYFITGLTIIVSSLEGCYYSTILDRVLNYGGFSLALILGYKVLSNYSIFDLSNRDEEKINPISNVLMQVFLFLALVFGFILFSLEAEEFNKYNSESCYIARFLVLTIFIALFAFLKKRNFFIGMWTNCVVLFVTYIYVIYLLKNLDFTYYSLLGFGKIIGILPGTVFLAIASFWWKSSYDWVSKQELEDNLLLKNNMLKNTVVANALLITGLAVWFYYSSQEVANLSIFKNKPIAVSVLWIIYSISMLFVGIKKDIKAARLGSLLLFAISIIKIFFNDLSTTPIVYRIIGCIITGIILILGALLYAKNFEKISNKKDFIAKENEE